jgi:hypothetical protein
MNELLAKFAKQADCRTMWRFVRFQSSLSFSQAKLDFIDWFSGRYDSRVAGLVFLKIERETRLWN